MNTLVKLSVLIVTFLVMLFTTTSCNLDYLAGIRGNGNVVSEDRTISSDFNSIKVQQGITVYLTQANSTKLNVEADENIIDLLITEVKNNELKIYFEKNVYKTKARNVYLTANNIDAIRTSSGAHVKGENTIETSNLDLDASSGSSIKIEVVTNEIRTETSSGAHIKIAGKTTNLSASSSSGSSIDADDLKSINTIAKASSGADIDVYVSEQLTAKASSGGSIEYKGNPSNIDKDTSSGGSVSKD